MEYTTGKVSYGKKYLYYEKVWETNSQAFPIRWGLLTFRVLWEID